MRLWRGIPRALALALFVLPVLPAAALAADPVFETYKVPTVGGNEMQLSLEVDRDHAHLTPLLVDVGPDGTTKTVSRGFLNLLYRNGLSTAQPIPPNEPIAATVTFKPPGSDLRGGDRVGVILQGSNTVWAVPDDPGATYTIGSALLELPLS